ncbi:MAG: hypothetical protein GY768_01260 [Planctomycetaceae bacterium]|nr:hypothetical protein [Planctomycetaceae bacterium]
MGVSDKSIRTLLVPRERCDQIRGGYKIKAEILQKVVESGKLDQYSENELSRVLLHALDCRAVLATIQTGRLLLPHSSAQLADQLVAGGVVAELNFALHLVQLGQATELEAKERKQVRNLISSSLFETGGRAHNSSYSGTFVSPLEDTGVPLPIPEKCIPSKPNVQQVTERR